MRAVSVAAIILAAGASTRLGRPKQLVVLQGETLLARAVRIATEAGLAPIIVVLNPIHDFGYAMQQLGCHVVLNPQAQEGIASSIRIGVLSASLLNATGAILMTCDQPAVTPSHLRALSEYPDSPTGSGYAGKIGIPAYFPSTSFHALLQLHGDTGARDLLRSARVIPTEDLAFDIDTEADLAKLLSSPQTSA